MGGALAPGALSAALFWQPYTKPPPASPSSKAASRPSGVDLFFLRLIDTRGLIFASLTSNLTILLGRNKIARAVTYWTQGKAVGYIEGYGCRLVPFQLSGRTIVQGSNVIIGRLFSKGNARTSWNGTNRSRGN